MDDIRLILEIKNGKVQLFDELIKKYYEKVYYYCYPHVDNKQAAQDLTQEVFMKVIKSIESYKHYGKFENYLYVIAGNLCKDFYKKESRYILVVGGAETLIRALLEIVGEEGTLMMPSQTWKNLDLATGVHWEEPEEWWPIIRENWPAYDKEVIPAIGMGAVAEMLRKWPGAKRSDYPVRSVAAVGKYAEYLTKDHDLSNIFGDNSPVGKLYELDGYVLLIGVGYEKNITIHEVGNAKVRFVKQRSLVDWTVEWMEKNRK